MHHTIYNAKNKTKSIVEFEKDQVSVLGELVSHKAGTYVVKVNGHKINILDSDVERVDPTGDEDIYQIYLTTNATKTVQHWQTVYEGGDIDVERVKYDIDSIINQLYNHCKDGLLDFYKQGKSEYPYYTLAYAVVMGLLQRMFGSVFTMLVGATASADLMVLIWLHGYLTSAAIRKQAVKIKSVSVEVPDQEMEERKKELKEFFDLVAEQMRTQNNPDGGDDGDERQQ